VNVWSPSQDPPKWPRLVASRDGLIWGARAGAELVAPVPSDLPRYEPPIVTTLRSYASRGSSIALLHRLAGGAAHYNTLNRFWDLDGATGSAAIAVLPAGARDPGARRRSIAEQGTPLHILGFELSADERRIALLQIIADYALAGQRVPTPSVLAEQLGASQGTVECDIDWLHAQRRVVCQVGSKTGQRSVTFAQPLTEGARA
jgi:hypothetical protein